MPIIAIADADAKGLVVSVTWNFNSHTPSLLSSRNVTFLVPWYFSSVPFAALNLTPLSFACIGIFLRGYEASSSHLHLSRE